MNLPWQLLCDERFTRADLLVYGVAKTRPTVIPEQLATVLPIEETDIAYSLDKLVTAGYLRRLDNGRVTAYTVTVAESAPKPEPVIEAPQPAPPADSRRKCLIAAQAAETSGEWSPEALVGLFYKLYKEMYHVEYRGRSLKEDIRLAETIKESCNGLSAWCIKALFQSPDLAWVKSKNLDFLSNPSLVTRFVVPVASALKKKVDTRPEWKAAPEAVPTTVGVYNNPLLRRQSV